MITSYVPVYKPYANQDVHRFARLALDSGWVSSKGEYIERAVDELKKIFGYKHVLLTCNGTAAGHLVAMAVRQLRKPPRFFFVPNNVYVAAWNSLLQEDFGGRFEPLDADEETWQARYELSDWIKHYPKECAALVVHNVGGVVNVPLLLRQFPNLLVIEDNCEGIFGTYEGKPTGTASFASSMSFYANKTVSSGEGGAFVTSDDDAYELACRLANQGQTDRRYVHDCLGFNYRMTNVQAGLLLGQLQHRQVILGMKYGVFGRYREAFAEMERIVLPKEESGTTNANWMMAIRVIGSPGFHQIEAFMNERGVEVRPMFYPMTRHKHLMSSGCTIKIAELLNKEVVMLPSFPELSRSAQDRVIDAVRDYTRSF